MIKEVKEAVLYFVEDWWTLIADDHHTTGYRSNLQFIDS